MNQPPDNPYLATTAHLPYLLHLQNKNTSALGFFTPQTYIDYLTLRRVWLQTENDDPCGFLVFGSHSLHRPQRDPLTLKVLQAVIQTDARRRKHAEHLIDQLKRYVVQHHFDHLSLWCATDLPSNEFWLSQGFEPVAIRPGGRRHHRGRLHTRYLWTRPSPQQLLLPLGPPPPTLPPATRTRSILTSTHNHPPDLPPDQNQLPLF